MTEAGDRSFDWVAALAVVSGALVIIPSLCCPTGGRNGAAVAAHMLSGNLARSYRFGLCRPVTVADTSRGC